MTIEYATRQAIADLPGKTVQPWRDDDARCHCTHCDLCGELYRTLDIDVHERECQAALLAAIGARTRTHCKRCTVEVCADVTLNPDGLCGHCVCDLGLVPASPAGETREAWAVRVLDAKVEDMGRPAYWKTRQRHDGHRECVLLGLRGERVLGRLGSTSAEARIAAATALSAADQSLPQWGTK